MSPLVSVLMAVHNGEQFLRAAIESVLGQTLGDFEFIIVDDGSTDATGAILDSFRDRRIVRRRQATNLGLTASLGRGLAAAQGRFVARLDADDFAEPSRFEDQVRAFAADPTLTVVGSWFRRIDESGLAIGDYECPCEPEAIRWELAKGNVISHSSIMMDRCKVAQLGGYDLQWQYAQDYDLWTRVIMCGGRISVLPRYLIRQRYWAGQVTTARRTEQDECAVGVARRYVQWLLRHPVRLNDVRAMMAVARGRWPADLHRWSGGMGLLHELLDACCRMTPRHVAARFRRQVCEALARLARNHPEGATGAGLMTALFVARREPGRLFTRWFAATLARAAVGSAIGRSSRRRRLDPDRSSGRSRRFEETTP